MTKNEFLNRVRSLFNIDGFELSDALDVKEQSAFVRDPVRFFMRADEQQAQAIFREVERRQPHRREDHK